MKIFLGNGKYMEGELSSVDFYVDNEKQKIDGYVINGNFYDEDSFRKKFTKYMNISEAWKMMEQGKQVKIEDWKNKYVYLTEDKQNYRLKQEEYLSCKWIVRECND
jgi:hypothetical protein